MLQELIVLRHAQAHPQSEGGDIARTLNADGIAEAAAVGRNLAGFGARPDLVLSSPAARAQGTAERVAASLGGTAMATDAAIYESDPARLLALLAERGDATCLLLVGHNPGVSELASLLLHGRSDELRSLPTAGYVWLALDANQPLEPGTARLVRYGSARAEATLRTAVGA